MSKQRLSKAELSEVAVASEAILQGQGFGRIVIEIKDGVIFRIETAVSRQYPASTFKIIELSSCDNNPITT